MMSADRSCKGCRDEYRVTDEQVQRILSSKMFNADNSVPEPVYEERLQHCKDCPKLTGGYTCSLCGCIVQITARLKDKSCTLPGNPLWHKFTE